MIASSSSSWILRLLALISLQVSLQDKDYERGKIQEHDRDDSDEDADEDADEEKSGNDSRSERYK